MGVDADAFRRVLGQWPSGVTVVSTTVADGWHGMTASAFASVSLDPPLISVAIGRGARSHDLISDADAFAVSILSKDQVTHGERFAGMHADVEDRTEGIQVETAETGCPVLLDALGWLDCRVWQAYDGGDHTIFVGEVVAAEVNPATAPLLYHDRAWGQFSDVLPRRVEVGTVGSHVGAVIDNAFGAGTPREVADIVADVERALATAPVAVVLDDHSATADPLQVRRTLQSVSGVAASTPVVLRFGDGPLASANVLTALKSGATRFEAGTPPYLDQATLGLLLERLEVTREVHDPAIYQETA